MLTETKAAPAWFTAPCVQCGGILRFNLSSQLVRCPACNTVAPLNMVQHEPSAAPLPPLQPEHALSWSNAQVVRVLVVRFPLHCFRSQHVLFQAIKAPEVKKAALKHQIDGQAFLNLTAENLRSLGVTA